MKRVDLKEDHTDIFLIKTFPSNRECKNNILSANLYVCTQIDTGDTLLVFELCQKVPNHLKNNYKYKDDLYLIIDKDDVLKQIPTAVEVDIPKDLAISKNTKYVFSSITRLVY